MLSWSSALVVGVVVLGLVALLTLERLREKRIRALPRALGRTSRGTVTEYTEGEDGYLPTYRFTPEGSPIEVERTEPLTRRPTQRPTAGTRISVTYLKGLPSASRAEVEALP
jgi:hypothetical protein